jgi:hypothetical protein
MAKRGANWSTKEHQAHKASHSPAVEFNYGYESGKQAKATGKHEPWTSHYSKNFEHPFNKPYGKGYEAGYYGKPKK